MEQKIAQPSGGQGEYPGLCICHLGISVRLIESCRSVAVHRLGQRVLDSILKCRRTIFMVWPDRAESLQPIGRLNAAAGQNALDAPDTRNGGLHDIDRFRTGFVQMLRCLLESGLVVNRG